MANRPEWNELTIPSDISIGKYLVPIELILGFHKCYNRLDFKVVYLQVPAKVSKYPLQCISTGNKSSSYKPVSAASINVIVLQTLHGRIFSSMNDCCCQLIDYLLMETLCMICCCNILLPTDCLLVPYS